MNTVVRSNADFIERVRTLIETETDPEKVSLMTAAMVEHSSFDEETIKQMDELFSEEEPTVLEVLGAFTVAQMLGVM